MDGQVTECAGPESGIRRTGQAKQGKQGKYGEGEQDAWRLI